MLAAAEEQDIPVTVGRGAYVGLEQGTVVHRPGDLVRADLDEVRPVEDSAERPEKGVILGVVGRRRAARMMRVEMMVAVLQPLELGVVLVVEDRAEQPAEMIEVLACDPVGEPGSARRAATSSPLRTGMKRSRPSFPISPVAIGSRLRPAP